MTEAQDGMNFAEAVNEEKLEDGKIQKPTSNDLDDIYDAINTLNTCEFFVETKEEVEALFKAQNILSKLLEEGEEGEKE